MGTTPDLGIPELSQSQANPDITHNEALIALQSLMKGVLDRHLNAPPVSPEEGDAYIVGSAPTGAWANRADRVAVYYAGVWKFIPGNDDTGTALPMDERQEGLSVFVVDEQLFYVWSGSPIAWVPLEAGSNRTALSGATEFHVNDNTGNDANDGLTSGTSWKTYAHALSEIFRNYDFNGYKVTLTEHYAGTITQQFVNLYQFIGQKDQNYQDSGFLFRGQGSTTWLNNGAAAVTSIAGRINVESISVGNAVATQQSFKVAEDAVVFAGSINFKAAQVGHSQSAGGQLHFYGTNTVEGSAPYLNVSESHGLTHFGSSTFNFTAPVTFSNALLLVGESSNLEIDLVSWTNPGNVTGRQAIVTTGGGLAPYAQRASIPGTLPWIEIGNFNQATERFDAQNGIHIVKDFGTGQATTDAPLVIENTNGGAVGGGLVTYHNSSSPANSDMVGFWNIYGRDSAANIQQYGQLAMQPTDVTSASEDSEWFFQTVVAGTLAHRMRVGAGVYHPSATGTDKGNNTLNIGQLYENNHRVATVDQNNNFTANQNIAGQLRATITGGSFAPANAPIVAETTNAATVGACVTGYHNSPSPAVNDAFALYTFYGNNDIAAQVRGGTYAFTWDNVTTTTEASHFDLYTMIAGALNVRLTVKNGMYMTGATGNDQGAGTINATGVYDDGVLLCAPLNPDMTLEDWNAIVPDRIIPAYREPQMVPTGRMLPAVKEKRMRLSGKRGPERKITAKNERHEEIILTVPGAELYEEYEVEIEPERPEFIAQMVETRPETREKRNHRTAKRHFQMLDEGFNPNRAEDYVERMRKDRAVPGLMTLDEFRARYQGGDEMDKQSAHERAERLQLAVDYLAVAFGDAVDRIAQLEARINGASPVDKAKSSR